VYSIGSQTRLCYIDIGDGITESYDLDTGDMVTQSHDEIYVTGRKNADFVKRAGIRLNMLFLSQVNFFFICKRRFYKSLTSNVYQSIMQFKQ